MTTADETTPRGRPGFWKWYVCGLLLLATTINYMDRQTLSTAAVQVKEELKLNNSEYGALEMGFGLAFAVGALVFGVMADHVSVRWLYPAVLVAWSVMGIATGYVESFWGLLFCRTLLGLFESGHWPCALKTTRQLMPASERTLGNSILQSGSSIGAILTPLVMLALLTDTVGSWRLAFQVIGWIGIGWAAVWLLSMRESDYASKEEPPAKASNEAAKPPIAKSVVRRLIVLICVVVAINTSWHFFRAWLPTILQEGRGYSKQFAFLFTSAFYIATDVGCIVAGFATVGLNKSGWSVGASRWIVFFAGAVTTSLSIVVAFTPPGPLLLVQLLLIGAGALALFPCYYALSQEISKRYLGTITGVLGAIAWSTSPLHVLFGQYVDRTKNYDLGFAVVGCLPLAASIIWLVVWDWKADKEPAKS